MADKKKAIRKSSKKKPAKHSKYDEVFVVDGNFQDLVKELVTPKKAVKQN